ncbi:hypothetical protein BC832DRAFT_601337 [Gaertneriomyces semiglobifer]|nr:hypothetical protein BC832DRAFT_601337 [Gaertneriomyces semiglobifer]
MTPPQEWRPHTLNVQYYLTQDLKELKVYFGASTWMMSEEDRNQMCLDMWNMYPHLQTAEGTNPLVCAEFLPTALMMYWRWKALPAVGYETVHTFCLTFQPFANPRRTPPPYQRPCRFCRGSLSELREKYLLKWEWTTAEMLGTVGFIKIVHEKLSGGNFLRSQIGDRDWVDFYTEFLGDVAHIFGEYTWANGRERYIVYEDLGGRIKEYDDADGKFYLLSLLADPKEIENVLASRQHRDIVTLDIVPPRKYDLLTSPFQSRLRPAVSCQEEDM